MAAASSGAHASVVRKRPTGIKVASVDPSSFSELPFVLAQKLGFFSQEGVEVQLVQTGDHHRAVELLRHGRVNAISTQYSSLLLSRAVIDPQGRSQRDALQSFVVQGRSPSMLLGAKVSAVGSDGRMDWRGKKVAVPDLASDGHRLARYLIERQMVGQDWHGAPATYVGIESPSSAMAAFQSGQVDAICYPDPVATLFERRGTMRVLADLRTAQGCRAALGGLVATGCLASSEDLIKARPEVCQALTNGVVRALQWIQTAGPLDVVKAVPEAYFRGDRGVYLSAFVRSRQAWSNDGVMPQGAAMTLAKVMVRTEGSVPVERLALETTFTNAFAEKTPERLRG